MSFSLRSLLSILYIHQHQYQLPCAVQDYMRELASCLLQAKDKTTTHSTADTAFARLQQLTCEASALMARMLLDVRMHNALIHGRMNTGSPTTNQLDRPFYQKLVVKLLSS